MEIEEFCNISISPLVTTPFAIQWSSDNQISIITERGIHVLGMQPSPMSPNPTIKFARSFVYPSDILPANAFVDKVDSLIWNLEREKIYSLLMEEAITPKLDGVNDTVIRIIQTAWSPKNLISPSQCVLAILTTVGAVELLHKVSNNWYSICDISSHRLKVVQDGIKANFNKCKKSCNQYAIITESMRQLQACSMTWSKFFKIEEISFAYFSVAYRSGDILIWKISKICNFTESLQPMLVGRIDLNTAVKINVLCWVTISTNEHLLVVGYFDGRICGVKLTHNDNNLQMALIEKYIDPDRIKINYLCIISQDKSNIKILAAKGVFLLLLCINPTGTLKSIQHLQVEGSNITGIIPIAVQQFLITTQDSHTFVVDIQSNDLVSIVIKNHLPRTRVQYLGLAHSPNKVIFVNVTSPNTVHDHLVVREPSIMHVFTIKGAMWDPLSIINNSTNLKNIWDCMEALRLKAVKAENPSKVLCPIPEKLESPSLYNLQVSMWMTVMLRVCTTKKAISHMDYVRKYKITQEFPLILLYSACAYLENSMKKNTHSKEQELAMNLLKRYLEACFIDEHEKNEDIMRQRVQKILNATASCPNQIEKCNLCNVVIDELYNARSCPHGHKFSRCITTLLQITLLEYFVCPICDQRFHSCLDEVYEEPQCQFCDVPILRKSYTFNISESELYGRNLSCSQNAESSKEPDLEEPSDKQGRNNGDTSYTYSVIMNDDKITEKWEFI